MSVVGPKRPTETDEHARLPHFDLECLFDDEDDPSEVTVVSCRDEDDLLTTWLTVDSDTAVPLEDVR
ncbi:hypothetical protein ACFO0N_11935 [Halobium salinum]|uniref:DUF7511 domain-containing protein n=1 Tax=Halobium salinum TaxID=1364940 RepID=A0ABD5PCG8_9EURY|nr:hypothetical protein [Halobium salinum]